MAVEIFSMDGSHYAPRFGVPPYGEPFHHQYGDYQHQFGGFQHHRRHGAGQPVGYFQGGHGGRPHFGFPQNPAYVAQRNKRKADAAPQPRLHELRQDNAKKSRRHFPQGQVEVTPGSTPRIAPSAPDNRHGFLLQPQGSFHLAEGAQGTLHAITPSVPGAGEQLWKNSYGNADKEAVALAAAAGLDFLGSFYDGDDDLELAGGASDADAGEAEPPAQEAEAPPPTLDEESSFPVAAKRKLASQAAYIAQLEEQQLTLRERIFLLEQQLAEARQLRGASPSGHSGDEDVSDDDRATSSSD